MDFSSQFESISSKKTGINFVNTIKNTQSLNILNYLYFYNGAGVATSDFNNDGLLDLYFTGNQVADKLYLNKGNFEFQDITETAQITNNKGWTTGVTVVDINNDGLLDLYICKVGDYRGIKGHNLLYINQGTNEEGIPTFKEESEGYGLNILSFATQAVFFDMDKDNDLDMFLLNHSVHPNSNYGRGVKRKQKDTLSGDRLYENQNGRFKDITKSSGIFQGKIGYGLGLGVSDLNNDSYPDIYVGNDFFENDYLYANNKNKTFTELIHQNPNKLGHTTHFSMGNDIADLNNDGWTDIISLDMLPENMETYKQSGKEYGYQTYYNYIKNGYAPQFMQNTLHFNRKNFDFSETGYLSNISATEWSWAPLIADFDNDGYSDIYITNGILGATNDMDFINFISDREIQKQLNKKFTDKELQLIKKIPQKKVPNYFFKNLQNRQFENVSNKWLSNNPNSYSHGAVYSDLDNDGDLDIVVNNTNNPAFILENKTIQATSAPNEKVHFLKVKFIGPQNNTFGIGAKVILYAGKKLWVKENYTTRGYLSAIAPQLHFGLGKTQTIDSLKLLWSDGKQELLTNIRANQTLELNYKNATENNAITGRNQKILLRPVNSIIPFKHKENSTIAFNRDPLIPYTYSNNGPDISVADVNNDGLNDLFICGSKKQSSALYLQNELGEFSEIQKPLFEQDALSEDVSSVFGDINNDGYQDLIVVSGGDEFRKGKAIQPRLYVNHKGNFIKDTTQFQTIETNASKVKLFDFDHDHDLDVWILSDVKPTEIGEIPQQFILENTGDGQFIDVTDKIAPEFSRIGNAKDIVFEDVNEDGKKDIIVVGHWMPITVFLNENNTFKKTVIKGIEKSNGWWNVIKSADFDQDGDMDFVIGNWGLNSRLKASKSEPVTLYHYDFDLNGKKDPIITYYFDGEETILTPKEELEKQLPFIKKKYLTHKEYSKASVKEILSSSRLKKATKRKVSQLATVYLENRGDNMFIQHTLPFMGQISSVNDILVYDFNSDGFLDILLAGNNYDISTQLSRLDASKGEVFLNNQKGNFYYADYEINVPKVSKSMDTITTKKGMYLLVGRNNDSIVTYNLK